jgi:DNA gyrase subunit A
MLVDENDDLVIITQEGMIIRQKVSDISIFERNTQGVHLINLRENDKVVDITLILRNQMKKNWIEKWKRQKMFLL